MVSFHIFSTILVFVFTHYAAADSCDSEVNKRDYAEMILEAPNVTDHLGPVTIESLRLPKFFDCLQNKTNLTSVVGYAPGVASVNVNVSMTELGDYNQTLIDECCDECCDTNSFSLTQFDYLVFRENWDDDYMPIAQAGSDQTIVRSNIVGEIGGANPEINGVLSPAGMTGDADWLMKRGTNMVINFQSSSYQGQTVCNAFTDVCVNRCKATNAIGTSTTRSGINHAGGYSHHQCTYKGRDDYKQVNSVHHKNTMYWAYGDASHWLYSGGMSTSNMGNY